MTQPDRADFPALFSSLSATIEKNLSLAPGTLDHLLRHGSDWELVIKLATIAEGASVGALVDALHREELRRHFGLMPQSKRIELLRDLGLLTVPLCRNLKALSTVRNRFAHRLENLSRSLSEYVQDLSVQERIELANDLHGIWPSPRFGATDARVVELPDQIRTLIVVTSVAPIATLAVVSHDAAIERLKQGRNALSNDILTALRPQIEEATGLDLRGLQG